MRIIARLKSLLRFRESKSHSASNDRGYSLIEILVVLAIMAVLASLVAPRLLGQVDRSKVTAAQAQISALKTALDTLRLDMGRYPTESEGLEFLVRSPSDPQLSAMWFGPYIEGELPVDPWGRPYEYAPPAVQDGTTRQAPAIISYGADGQPGGEGMNADIISQGAAVENSALSSAD